MLVFIFLCLTILPFAFIVNKKNDLQIQTTVSPLLSSNNIIINADGGDGNINMLSAILTGQSDLNLNGNVSMQSLQDLYYQYDFSQATSMNLGALLGMLVAAVVIGAVIASSVGVGLQVGITVAIDAKNGGAAATQAMQSGSGNQTIAEYNASNGGSLLFGGNINTTHNTNIDSATSIQSQNINQASQTNESASYESKHETIGPDWNQLMTDAAINGVVGGVTVAAGPLIESGISQLSSFVSKSFGFTDDAAELAATTMTKDEIVQAGMNNITAEKHIAKAINNLSSTPEKALNSVDNTVDILGELGKKALPDPMNGISRIVDNAVPDMTLGSNIKDLAKNTLVDGLDSGVAKPAYLHVPGLSGKIGYFMDDPAIVPGVLIGGTVGKLTRIPYLDMLGAAGGGYVSKAIINNIAREAITAPTLESIKNVNILLNLK